MVGAIRAAAHSLRGEAVTRLETGSSFRKRIHSTIDAAVALPSFPLEWCCHQAPIASAAHSVMVFQQPVMNRIKQDGAGNIE